MIEVIKPDQWYPVGTQIDFAVHGFHLPQPSLFSVILESGDGVKNCKYEGYFDMFNSNGKVLPGVKEFMLQGS